MAVGCLRVLSILVGIFAFCIYVIHNAAPFLRLECVAIGINCPIAKTYGMIDDKDWNAIYVKPLKQIMQSWIRNGYSTGTQLSIFIDNKEKLNIMAKDEAKYPNFDQTSIMPIHSTTKNFAAILIAIAIQNKWIKSYDDYITDYWPEFPTKKITISINDYLKYYDKYSSNTSHLNMDTFFEFNKNNSMKIYKEPYYVKIEDILRHEAGLSVLLTNDPINFVTTTYKECCKLIENHGYLIYFQESRRTYHALSRGYILNELFMRIEPKHRSMSKYFIDEIQPKLIENKIGENEYILKFDGLSNDNKLINKMYHIIQQPIYWILYHVALPIKLGLNEPLNKIFEKQICPSSNIMDTNLCPNSTLFQAKSYRNVGLKLYVGNIIGLDNTDSTSLSKIYRNNKLGMNHMSTSGVSNAHSISKTLSYILFSGNILNKEMLNKVISEPTDKFDIFFQRNTLFTKGGFHKKTCHGIDWYGWGGSGGSILYFAPNHKTVVAFTVTAFSSPHYIELNEPRSNTILNLVSQQLLHDNL